VVQDGGVTGGPGDTGYEDRGEEGAGVDIEVIIRSRERFQSLIGERLVGVPGEYYR